MLTSKVWRVAGDGREKQIEDSEIECKFAISKAFFMPKAIRLRAARLRRDMVERRRDQLVAGR